MDNQDDKICLRKYLLDWQVSQPITQLWLLPLAYPPPNQLQSHSTLLAQIRFLALEKYKPELHVLAVNDQFYLNDRKSKEPMARLTFTQCYC